MEDSLTDMSNLTFKSKFVGRSQELKTLMRCLEAAINGRGNLVLIAGEVGVGKTRLVNELIDSARKQNITVLSSRCIYHVGTTPYLPFIELLKKYFTGRYDEKGPTPLGLLPMNAITRGEELDSHETRMRMFESVMEFLIELAERMPILLFVDDLHWADIGSLQLLYYIAQRAREFPILICCAYRPEELQQQQEEPYGVGTRLLSDTLQRMTREKLYTHISLNRLSMAEVREMLDSIFSGWNVSALIPELIYEKTGGNPFFVEEIVRSLWDDGTLYFDAGNIQVKKRVKQLKLPTTIRAVIARRIAKLDPDAIKLLQFAAVISKNITVPLLQQAVEWNEEQVLEALEKLIAQKLLVEVPTDGEVVYEFDNIVTLDAVRTTLSRTRTRYLHKKIGKIIETLTRGRNHETVYELAYHYIEAGELDKALPYLIKAGDDASNFYAFDAAIKYYKLAIDKINQIKDRVMDIKTKDVYKIELISKLGDMHFILGDWTAAEGYYQEALDLGLPHQEDSTVNVMILRLYRKLGNICRARSDWDDALANYNKCLAITDRLKALPQELGEREVAIIHRCIGDVYFRTARYKDAQDAYFKYIEFAQRSGDPSELARAYVIFGDLMFREGRYDNAINYYRDGLERFDKLDVHYECARVHNRIGECYKLKGDYTKSLGYIKKCIEVAERIGAARILGYGFTNGGEVYARIGDAKRAIAYIESAEKLFRRLEDVFGQALVQGAYGCAYRAQGDLGTAIEYLSKSLDMLETKVHMPFWIAYVSYELSTIYREREDTLRAKLLLEKAVKIYEEMGNEFWVDKCKEELSVTK